MRLQKFTKTPDEIKRYGIDYTKWLDTKEVIQNVTLQVDGPDAALTADNSQILPDGKKLSFYVGGGTVNKVYKVYVEISTSAQQLREDTVPFVLVAP